MKENPWEQWLRNWLNRHPLREPPEELQKDYVRQVMEKVRPDFAPAREPAWRLWVQPPRLAFAGALAAAALVVAVHRGPVQIVPLERDAQVLLETGELVPLNGNHLEEALQEQDRIVLAEAVEKEKWWSDFVKDSELLEELDETNSHEQGKVANDEDLLQEIRASDEQEMAVS